MIVTTDDAVHIINATMGMLFRSDACARLGGISVLMSTDEPHDSISQTTVRGLIAAMTIT